MDSLSLRLRDRKDIWDPSVAVEENFHNWSKAPQIRPPSKPAPLRSGPTVVDVFSGCGGFSVGFSMAGFTPILGIDIHPPSLETYALNHPTAATILGDIRRVDDEVVLNAVGGQRVSVVTAGVPCQGFSICNRKRHDEDNRNFLFREFVRVIKILNPEVVVLENVAGIRAAKGGAFEEAIKSQISESGYEVECRVLNARNYGVPQIRQRVFFQGVRPGREIRWPAPTHGPGKARYVTVWDAIGDLPPLLPSEESSEYANGASTAYQRLMRKRCKRLHNHEAPRHPSATVKKIASTKPGEPMYPEFKQRIRLQKDGLSPTQVSGGIRPQFQLGHPTQARGLTVRERCRIQSFPDGFRVLGGTVQERVQTGNAVPPLLAHALAKQIRGVIGNEPRTAKTLPKESAALELFA